MAFLTLSLSWNVRTLVPSILLPVPRGGLQHFLLSEGNSGTGAWMSKAHGRGGAGT